MRYGERSLRGLGPKISNNLPTHVKSASNLLSFKRLIKSWDSVSWNCILCKKLQNNINTLVNTLVIHTHTQDILWIVIIYFELVNRFRLALCMSYTFICIFFSTINKLQQNTITQQHILLLFKSFGFGYCYNVYMSLHSVAQLSRNLGRCAWKTFGYMHLVWIETALLFLQSDGRFPSFGLYLLVSL